jgi:hypothetical protein
MDNEGRKSYWVRFRVENPAPEAVTVFLANHYPTTDHLRLYELGPDQTLALIEEQGDQSAYSRRSMRHRFPVFRVKLTSGVHTFYMEQQSFASIQYPLKIWQPDAFMTFATHENLMLGGIIGMCIFALMYNFFIFLRLKADVYFLYVLHNLTICIFLANFLGFTQSVILPNTDRSWWLNTGAKVNMDIVHITAISFTLVFLDMKKNAPRWHRFFMILMAVAVLTLLNTLTFRFHFNTQTALFSMVASMSLLLASFSLWRKLTYARYYTLGWCFILLLNIATMLSLLGALPTDITWISWSQSLGHCVELCLLSLALGERMAWINRLREETLLELTKTKSNLVTTEQERVRIQAHLLEERERHIRDLDRKVAERTRDLQSILNNLQQGIFAIRLEQGRCVMDPDYSPFLHSILGAFDSGHVNPVDLLFHGSLLGNDDRSRIHSSLISMMDGDRIAFDMNSASLPREIERRGDESAKILEIDWDPMVDHEGRIQKILVAVRDVTEFRTLRHQLMTQTEDLMVARDLLQDGNAAPVSGIEKIAADLGSLLQGSLDDANLVLRRLHSLKGDSRSLLLAALSEAIHEAETVWQLERQANERSLMTLNHAARLARRYYDICKAFERRFQRSATAAHVVHELQVIPLRELLDLAQLPALARELDKIPPQIQIDDQKIPLTEDEIDTLRECFGHLLRNAMDHGLETADERRKANKSEQGSVTVRMLDDETHWTIIMEDDGRGLHLTRLREKALARGLNPCVGNDSAAAHLIFEAELSTRDEVSMISGRGIGMDAVHHAITSLGGTIEVELLPGAKAPGHSMFALHIRLPKDRQRQSRRREIPPTQVGGAI